MNYVMLLRWKQGLTREQRDGALARRSQWGLGLVRSYYLKWFAPCVYGARATDVPPLMPRHRGRATAARTGEGAAH